MSSGQWGLESTKVNASWKPLMLTRKRWNTAWGDKICIIVTLRWVRKERPSLTGNNLTDKRAVNTTGGRTHHVSSGALGFSVSVSWTNPPQTFCCFLIKNNNSIFRSRGGDSSLCLLSARSYDNGDINFRIYSQAKRPQRFQSRLGVSWSDLREPMCVYKTNQLERNQNVLFFPPVGQFSFLFTFDFSLSCDGKEKRWHSAGPHRAGDS